MTNVQRCTVLLSLRIVALWNRDLRLSITLPLLYYWMYVYVHSIQGEFKICVSFSYCELVHTSIVTAPPFPSFVGCFGIGAIEAVIWTWALLMV